MDIAEIIRVAEPERLGLLRIIGNLADEYKRRLVEAVRDAAGDVIEAMLEEVLDEKSADVYETFRHLPMDGPFGDEPEEAIRIVADDDAACQRTPT